MTVESFSPMCIRISGMLESLIDKKLAARPSCYYGEPSLAELKKEGITAVIDLNQDSKEMMKPQGLGSYMSPIRD